MMQEKKIFYLQSIHNPFSPSLLGGQKVIIQHAMMLRQLGYSTYIVVTMGRMEFFLNRRIKADELYITERQFKQMVNINKDFIVLPGRYLSKLDSFPGKNKVLFSQGAFITLSALDENSNTQSLWKNPTLKAIMCVSEGNANLLRQFKPNCQISVVPNSLETSKVSIKPKKPIILYPSLSRYEKNPLDTKILIHLIKSKLNVNQNTGSQVSFVELKGMTSKQVDEILAEASVLLFLGVNEGLPLQILEALEHGVIILGFNRQPISDLLHPDCIFEIDDLPRIADTVVNIIESPNKWMRIVDWSKNKAKEFSKDNQQRALKIFWESVFHALDEEL